LPQKNGGGIIHKIVEAAGIQSSDAVYEVKRKKPTNGGHQPYDKRELHVGRQKTKCHMLEAEIERKQKKQYLCVFVEHVVFCMWFQISVT